MMNNLRMLLILAAVGSITAPAFSADDGKAHRRSGALDEGFKELMKDELDYLQKKGADVPADAAARAKQSEDLLRLIEKAYPSLRTVTAKESEDFKQGKFDDQANTARIKEITASASREKRELPATAVWVIDASLAGKLKGKELEAGKRFLDGLLMMMKQQEKK